VSGGRHPDYRRDAVVRDWQRPAVVVGWERPDSLAHGLAQFSRERIGQQKDVAGRCGWHVQAVSRMFLGIDKLTPAKVNRILDACEATDEERAIFNQWGAREAGWRF
jgi:hypothetical protein